MVTEWIPSQSSVGGDGGGATGLSWCSATLVLTPTLVIALLLQLRAEQGEKLRLAFALAGKAVRDDMRELLHAAGGDEELLLEVVEAARLRSALAGVLVAGPTTQTRPRQLGDILALSAQRRIRQKKGLG